MRVRTTNDVLNQIGIAYQKSLDKKMAHIESQLQLERVTDSMTALMMHIVIRDWTDGLQVFDGVFLNVDDIRECDTYDAKEIVQMINKYWRLKNLADSCAFIDDNTMVLQTIIKKGHTITADLSVKQNWNEYLSDRVKSQKQAICGFITHRYDKYCD